MTLDLVGVVEAAAEPLPGLLDQELEDKVLDVVAEEARHRRLGLEDSFRDFLLRVFLALDSEGAGAGE